MALVIDKECWKLGAIYRYACRRILDRAAIADLICGRVGFNRKDALQLATLWVGTFR